MDKLPEFQKCLSAVQRQDGMVEGARARWSAARIKWLSCPQPNGDPEIEKARDEALVAYRDAEHEYIGELERMVSEQKLALVTVRAELGTS